MRRRRSATPARPEPDAFLGQARRTQGSLPARAGSYHQASSGGQILRDSGLLCSSHHCPHTRDRRFNYCSCRTRTWVVSRISSEVGSGTRSEVHTLLSGRSSTLADESLHSAIGRGRRTRCPSLHPRSPRSRPARQATRATPPPLQACLRLGRSHVSSGSRKASSKPIPQFGTVLISSQSSKGVPSRASPVTQASVSPMAMPVSWVA